MYEIYGIGNALMDVLVKVDNEEISKLNLNKGTFNLVDEKKLLELIEYVKDKNPEFEGGGSVANSLAVYGQLKGKAVFTGKIGKDDYGKKFDSKFTNIGVTTKLISTTTPTGTCISFITSDTERTMAVHLGAAITLEPNDIKLDDIKNSKMIHIGGYVLEDLTLRETSLHVLKFAKENGIKISIDCADPGVLQRSGQDVKDIILNYGDIIFANEEEAKELTGLNDPKEAVAEIGKHCEIAIVKIGSEGSYIYRKNCQNDSDDKENVAEELITVEAVRVDAVDTTGAGDVYAGAFLYGLNQGFDLEKCGRLAAFLAAKIVQKVGARFTEFPEIDGYV